MLDHIIVNGSPQSEPEAPINLRDVWVLATYG